MSWQSYIKDQLIPGGCMYATINGLDGSMWACSKDFTVLPEEVVRIASLLEKNDLSPLATNGFTIAGQNYTFTRGEVDDDEGGPSSVQGRCKEEGKSSQGVILYSTGNCLIIGVHDPQFSNGTSFGLLNTNMGRLCDYLIENGF